LKGGAGVRGREKRGSGGGTEKKTEKGRKIDSLGKWQRGKKWKGR